jgi:pilus assembly protein TadC
MRLKKIFNFPNYEVLDFMFLSFFNGMAIGLLIALLVVSNRYFPNIYLVVGGLLLLAYLLYYQFLALRYLAYRIFSKEEKEDDNNEKDINIDDISISGDVPKC